jgi:TolB-like protein
MGKLIPDFVSRPGKTMSFAAELKDRKIVQWALAYLASAWLLMQLIDVVGERWGVSDGASRIIDVVLVIGFFITLVVAWYHGEQGRQWVSGPELVIIAALLGIGAIALWVLEGRHGDAETTVGSATRVAPPVDIDAAPWIAVLPFRVQADDPGLEAFAAGLTDDVTAALSRFSHLLVLSRSATENVSADIADVRQLGEALGARYVMEGSLRGSGETLRLTVQLMDARNGTTVWSETLDRQLDPSSTLQLQDEMTGRIVASVADVNGVVTRTLAAQIDDSAPETLTPYEAVLRWSINRRRVSEQDHLETRIALERAVRLEPDYADAWACLSHTYLEEYMSDFNVEPDSLGRALEAAQTAVGLDPASSLTQYALALVQYFRQDLGAFRAGIERVIELNPLDTNAIAMLAILLGYSGDWEQSIALTTQAMELNPDHPGWYRFNSFMNEYRQGHYAAALDIAQRINMPGYWGDPLARTVAHARLGNDTEAGAAAAELLALWPDFEAEYYRKGLLNWIYNQPELVEQIIDGLRRAGLKMITE